MKIVETLSLNAPMKIMDAPEKINIDAILAETQADAGRARALKEIFRYGVPYTDLIRLILDF